MINSYFACKKAKKGEFNKEKNKNMSVGGGYAKMKVDIIFVFALILFSILFMSSKSYASDNYIYFDLSYGDISFTDEAYSGYDSNGNIISDSHISSNKYCISQSNTVTNYTVSIGTASVATTTDFEIHFNGVNIDAPKTVSNHKPAVYVNTNSGNVYLIANDNTTNIFKSYGKIFTNGNKSALLDESERFGHAAIEKEVDTKGTLVVTCESGFSNYKKNNTTGHDCSNSGACGIVNAYSFGESFFNTSGSTRTGAAAAIGSKAETSATADKRTSLTNAPTMGTLYNLVIAGGVITAEGSVGNANSSSMLGGSPGIGVGAGFQQYSIGYALDKLIITGGHINSIAGDGSSACIGGGYHAGYVTIDIYGGTIIATSQLTNNKDPKRGPGIGGGGGGSTSNATAGATVNIYDGNITAYSEFGAAIGSGAGGTNGLAQAATVNIYGGHINAETKKGKGDGAGAAIGTGGSLGTGRGGKATINISGGTIYASSELGADIGGGGTNSTNKSGVGGNGIVNISGGYIVAMTGGIGGGNANAGNGGDAELTISGGTIYASKINGGNSKSNNGGKAIITINDGIINSGSIGGGITNSETAKIGSAQVNIKGGNVHGQIIMDSTNLEDGDLCYFNMTGGTIDMNLTNSEYEYTFSKEDGAVVYIVGESTSGQDIATMSGGIIKNGIANNGGAIYIAGGGSMTMTGGRIEDCSARNNGGAIYIDGGNFELSGNGVIENCKSINGGTIYISEGNVTLNGGTIANSNATNGGSIYVDGGNIDIKNGNITNSKAVNGGGVYISNGNINMTGGNISNNQAEEYGGGVYAYSDTTDLSISITSGSIIGNIAGINGGGIGINMASGLKGIVTLGLEECEGRDNTHSHPIIKDNTSNKYGGGFWLNGDNLTMNMYCGSIYENIAILEAGSSNIYQTGGNATVYGGEVVGGVIVVGGEYVYLPEEQMPEMTIVYDSNNPDNQTQTVAYVTKGVEVYLPKNVFTKSGYVLYGWSTEPDPATDDNVLISGMPYVIDNEITLYAIWKKEGAGHIKTPVIKSGRYYTEITGGTNVMISQTSSFTAQMALLQVDASFYANRILIFDKNLMNGTKITMLDCSNKNNIQYYNYEVKNDTTNTINLTEFNKNGTTEKFENSTSTNIVDEMFLFIVDLPKNNTTTGAMSLTLKREPQSTEVAAVEQVVTYTTTEKRNIEFTYNIEKGNNNISSVDDTINFNYQMVNSTGEDSSFENRNIAVIIKTENNEKLPASTIISNGNNNYYVNSSGNIIIPFGKVNNNAQININLSSKTLNLTGINLKAELWISANTDATNPCMGELVGEISNIKLEKAEVPSIKSTINKKMYNEESFSGELMINYETMKINDYDVIVELQKKNAENIYETINEKLKSVNGKYKNTDGEIKLKLKDSGTLDIELSEELKTQNGIYRILLKVFDGDDKIYELPNNFIIAK